MKLTADNIRAWWQWTLFAIIAGIAVWYATDLTERMNADEYREQPQIVQPYESSENQP